MLLLIPIDCKDKRYGGNIQNYEKNLNKSGERSTEMTKESNKGCGKGILGTKRKVNNNHGRTYDNDTG